MWEFHLHFIICSFFFFFFCHNFNGPWLMCAQHNDIYTVTVKYVIKSWGKMFCKFATNATGNVYLFWHLVQWADIIVSIFLTHQRSFSLIRSTQLECWHSQTNTNPLIWWRNANFRWHTIRSYLAHHIMSSLIWLDNACAW